MTAPHDSERTFANLLLRYRQAAALTQEELAERSGLTSRTISDLERGRTARPYYRSVRLLAEALDLPSPARENLIHAARSRTAADGADAVGAHDHPESSSWPGMAVPQQLPAAVPFFVGRAAEMRTLSNILDEPGSGGGPGGVIVVSGTAGVGKTALTTHWGHQAAARFPDGELYMNLRGFDPSGQPVQPADAIRTFLEALQVPADRIPPGAPGREGLYRSLLASKRMLIVLDNARDADQVRPLLPGGRTCQVIITSRDQMTGLVATEGALQVSLGVLDHTDARNLLDLRLRNARVAHEPEAADKLVELCARLPLALGIAAARAAAHPRFPLAALVAELQQVGSTLDILNGGDLASDLRAVFSWSYLGLSADAARMFRLAGIHPGPDIAVPAAASLAGVSMPLARQLLGELARAHLLAEHAPGRYSCHDLLSAYAVEEAGLTESESERRAAVHRLLNHYLCTAQAADRLMHAYRRPVVLTPLGSGVTLHHLTSQEQALGWFDAEHRNLIAAVTLAADSGLDTYAWQLPWVLETFLYRRSHWHDWSATQHTALAAAQRLGEHDALTEAHTGVAAAQVLLGHPDDALRHLAQALRLSEEADDLAGQVNVHLAIARTKGRQRRFGEALDATQRGLRLCQAARDRVRPVQEGKALNQMGWELSRLGRHQEALGYCQQAVTLLQRLGDRHTTSDALDSLAHALCHLGRHAEAARCYGRAVDLKNQLGERHTQAETLMDAGDAHRAGGDIPAARSAWTRALAILSELHHPDASQVLARLDAPISGPRQRLVASAGGAGVRPYVWLAAVGIAIKPGFASDTELRGP